MLPEYMLIVVGENLTLTWWAIVTAIIDETTATFGSQGSVRVCVSVCVLLLNLCFFFLFCWPVLQKVSEWLPRFVCIGIICLVYCERFLNEK